MFPLSNKFIYNLTMMKERLLKFNNYEFRIITILIFSDRAITFIAEELNTKELYLFHELEFQVDSAAWLTVKISIKKYHMLLNNLISFQKAFFKSENKSWVLFRVFENQIHDQVLSNIKEYKKYFPKKKIYIGDKINFNKI